MEKRLISNEEIILFARAVRAGSSDEELAKFINSLEQPQEYKSIDKGLIASNLIIFAREFKNKRPTELSFEELIDVVYEVVNFKIPEAYKGEK